LQLLNNQWLPEVNGGEERNATLALNWYLNNYLRTSLNYVHVLDLEGGSYDNKDLDALQLRMQLAF
jgi:phosphate-selective porin OprO/OprP